MELCANATWPDAVIAVSLVVGGVAIVLAAIWMMVR